jgi:hypothetical protein
MPRVRYVRASRYAYGKPSGKPVIVFDCPFEFTQLESPATVR